MPLYEYKCGSCGQVFEIIQKFSDMPLVVHEKCGGTVERLISTSALQFKGSGWYVNDYGKGNKQPKADATNGAAQSEKTAGSASPSQSSGKSQRSSKPETAPQTSPPTP